MILQIPIFALITKSLLIVFCFLNALQMESNILSHLVGIQTLSQLLVVIFGMHHQVIWRSQGALLLATHYTCADDEEL